MNTKRVRATWALAKKLLAIRLWLDLSQEEMLSLVEPGVDISQRARISLWEKARREPFRLTLIRYALIAEISLEELLLDERELPARITGKKHPRAKDSDETEAAAQPAPAETAEESQAASTSVADSSVTEANESIDSAAQGSECADSTEPVQPAKPSAGNDASSQHALIDADQNAALDAASDRLIAGQEPEEMTIHLTSELLDALDSVRIELLALIPRPRRQFLDASLLIGICCRVLLDQHRQTSQHSILARQIRRALKESN